MCFSATASFTSSAVLALVGALTWHEVKYKKQLFLASIPLIFAIQQFIEGMIWITHPESQSHMLAIFYLFIAILVWPIWIPLSFYVIEKQLVQKRRLGVLVIGGIILDCLMLLGFFALASVDQLQVATAENHIHYITPADLGISYLLLYYFVTMTPPFASSLKYSNWLGVANILGAAVALLFYNKMMISVWCFFAAWISIGIYLILRKNRNI